MLTLKVWLILCSCTDLCLGLPRIKVPPGSLPGTKILLIPDLPPLYTGDNVTEFLQLCTKGCTPDCPLVSVQQDTDPCTEEDQAIIQNLEKAKRTVRAFLEGLQNEKKEMIVFYILLGIILIMGGFLIQQKHFHYKTLFDWQYPDPTEGMPLWQYKRMKFAPVSVPDQRVK